MSYNTDHTAYDADSLNGEVIPLYTGDASFRQQVEQYKRDGRAREIARIELHAEMTNTPDLSLYTRMTLRDELAAPPPERRFAVESLVTSGGIATLPSSRKTGKTTFLANLAQAGVDGDLFLGRFATVLDGRLVAVNAEMGRYDYLDSYRKLGVKRDDRISVLHCRDDGVRLNLLDDVTAERFVKLLRELRAEWLFLDPWKNFLAWAGVGLNDNDAVNRLMTRVQEIHAAADIKLTVIAMHTTQTAQEAGMERAKGAGEVEDSADAMWRYVRSAGGRGAARVLSVEGRGGAGLDETVVHFDELSGRLTLGEGDRTVAEADRISPDVIEYVLANPDSGVRSIQDAMMAMGHEQTATRHAIKRLVNRGTLITSSGPRNAILHRVPESAIN